MNILNARREGGSLIISAPISEIMKFLTSFKPGEYEIVKAKKKRSQEANKYLWALADKIASAVGTTKEEVYRHAIREVGEYVQLVIADEAVKDFGESWAHNGIAWFTDVADYAEYGKKLVFAYKGSSSYDTKAMSRLIDFVIDDAKALGIETLTPEELERMMASWTN